jgi:hypothetical protein
MTAKEVIKQAKFFSNTRNSNLTDFYINTNLLTSLYRDIYQDIINNSNNFIQVIETSSSVIDIDDVYKVAYVGYKNGREILPSSLRRRIADCYYIENNRLYLPAGDKVVKLCPLPSTITCPDEPVEYTGTIPSLMINQGVNEDLTLTLEPKRFQGEDILFSNLPDWMEKEGTEIVNVNVSDPYCFVSYSDNTVRLYSSPDYWTDWNPNILTGKEFQGRVLAFTSNQETGKGVIYYDNVKGKYYYGSFVPDTVLEFPSNTPFTLLVYRLAAILASLSGLDNPYLTNQLIPEAEVKFYQSVSKGNATRVANIRG